MNSIMSEESQPEFRNVCDNSHVILDARPSNTLVHGLSIGTQVSGYHFLGILSSVSKLEVLAQKKLAMTSTQQTRSTT